VLANVNRNGEARPEPYRAEDFICWRDTGQSESEEPIWIEDAVAHSNLMRAAMFGIAPKNCDSVDLPSTNQE
jgi:hypothetical protein